MLIWTKYIHLDNMTDSLYQGGYLEGKLRLPQEGEDGLRVVISTRPDRCVLQKQVTMQKLQMELSGRWQTSLHLYLILFVMRFLQQTPLKTSIIHSFSN